MSLNQLPPDQKTTPFTPAPSAPVPAPAAAPAPPLVATNLAPPSASAAPLSPADATKVFGHLADAPAAAPVAAPAPQTASAPTAATPAAAGPAAAGPVADPTKAPPKPPTVADYAGGLDKGLDTLITGNRTTRAELDKEVSTGAANRDQTANQLNGSRQQLLDQLNQRSGVYDQQINGLETQLGKVGKNPTPEQKAELAQIASLTKDKDKYSDQQTALQRWHDRNEINSIDNQLKANMDPKQKAQLLARKKQLATGLLSTVKHYEQFDPQWGSTVYGKDSSYTNMTQAGCGPTGLADLLDFADQEDPEGKHSQGIHDPYTPRKVADYATTHGRVKGSGTDGATMMRDLPTGFPGFYGGTLSGSQAAATQLQDGKPVLFLGHNITGQGGDGKKIAPYGGHFMVLSGVSDDGNNFQVTDGGRNNNRNMHSITSAQLAGHTDGYWDVNR